MSKQDVFGVLPTGYGKSLCYACLLSVFEKLEGLIIVVTPLAVIMKDQVSYTVKK